MEQPLHSHAEPADRRVEACRDPAVYCVGQTLVAIVNDPRKAKPSLWTSLYNAEHLGPEAPPPPDPAKYPPISRADLQPYLSVIQGRLHGFWHDRLSLAQVAQAPGAHAVPLSYTITPLYQAA